MLLEKYLAQMNEDVTTIQRLENELKNSPKVLNILPQKLYLVKKQIFYMN